MFWHQETILKSNLFLNIIDVLRGNADVMRMHKFGSTALLSQQRLDKQSCAHEPDYSFNVVQHCTTSDVSGVIPDLPEERATHT